MRDDSWESKLAAVYAENDLAKRQLDDALQYLVENLDALPPGEATAEEITMMLSRASEAKTSLSANQEYLLKYQVLASGDDVKQGKIPLASVCQQVLNDGKTLREAAQRIEFELRREVQAMQDDEERDQFRRLTENLSSGLPSTVHCRLRTAALLWRLKQWQRGVRGASFLLKDIKHTLNCNVEWMAELHQNLLRNSGVSADANQVVDPSAKNTPSVMVHKEIVEAERRLMATLQRTIMAKCLAEQEEKVHSAELTEILEEASKVQNIAVGVLRKKLPLLVAASGNLRHADQGAIVALAPLRESMVSFANTVHLGGLRWQEDGFDNWMRCSFGDLGVEWREEVAAGQRVLRPVWTSMARGQ